MPISMTRCGLVTRSATRILIEVPSFSVIPHLSFTYPSLVSHFIMNILRIYPTRDVLIAELKILQSTYK